MLMAGKALAALALACACASVTPAARAAAPSAEEAATVASDDVRQMARWVLASDDHHGASFAIVDKKAARLHLFDPRGHAIASTSVLIGLARGDDAVPGLGDIPPSRIPPAQRTTPAGRFVSEPGRNLSGEDVVWIDYDAGLAIHRLRPATEAEHRPERLASTAPEDHRISAGCVIVPVAFYEQVVQRTLGRARGVVYVLPETRPLGEVFAAGESAL
jgi:hypothetical protein